ncbi:MAG: hypothetical protein Q9219_007291, partial [cf. Caloplaca sp. 3 TL-2023]
DKFRRLLLPLAPSRSFQTVDSTLQAWPEGCRAILFASADRNISGSTWFEDVRLKFDAMDGAGALNSERAVRIARRKRVNADAYESLGWEIGSYSANSFDGSNGLSWDRYRIQARTASWPGRSVRIKAALAWDSETTTKFLGWRYSELTVDLDLRVYDMNDTLVAISASFDNSYEIVGV